MNIFVVVEIVFSRRIIITSRGFQPGGFFGLPKNPPDDTDINFSVRGLIKHVPREEISEVHALSTPRIRKIFISIIRLKPSDVHYFKF